MTCLSLKQKIFEKDGITKGRTVGILIPTLKSIRIGTLTARLVCCNREWQNKAGYCCLFLIVRARKIYKPEDSTIAIKAVLLSYANIKDWFH